jgi:hypothetical protein
MILVAASIAVPAPSAAVETGSSLWIMGSTGFGAGIIPDPGFHFANLTWVTDFSIAQDITSGVFRVTALDIDVVMNAQIPTYTGKIERWGARYKLLAFIPLVWLDGTYRVEGGSDVSGREDARLGDIGLEAAVGWQRKSILSVASLNFDYATGLLVVVPTGTYDPQEVLNAGKNRWMFQPNFSYTLFHEATGIEVSQRLMYAFNTTNDKTDYSSGQEFHFDYAVGKRFDFGLTAGIFGFWYRQTTADSGQGATAGSLEGRSRGFGPLLQYSGGVHGRSVSGVVRYLKVVEDENRVDDNSFFFQLAVSF